MKTLKLALLGGAAIAVMAVSAQADEVSDLKSQLEALQARVSQIEAQPAQASAVPAGASLMMFKDGQAYVDPTPLQADNRPNAEHGFSIAITPTADMPAPVAEVTVSGNIRTLLTYNNVDEEHSFLDVQSRARLIVNGKTDTAVGEVGGHIRLQGGDPVDGSTSASMNEWWGYWQMNEGWRLQAGRWDTASAVQSGFDWDAYLSGYAQHVAPGGGFNSVGPTDGGTEQIRLIYNSGPITWAVSVEDAPGSQAADTESKLPDVAAYVQYDGDGVMLMLSGLVGEDSREAGDDQTDWFVGAGARFGLGSIATLSLAAGYGDGYVRNTVISLDDRDTNYWGASALLTFQMNEATRFELGGGWSDTDNNDVDVVESKWLVSGGLYWNPVSQLTLGLIGDYTDNNMTTGSNIQEFNITFGTWFFF